MSRSFQAIATVLGVIVCVATIVAGWQTNRSLTVGCIFALALSIIWIAWSDRLRGYGDLRHGLKILSEKFNHEGYRPDIILAFNRTGSIFASMIATNMAVDRVVTIDRFRERSTPRPEGFTVGAFASLNAKAFRNKKILIVFMVIDTLKSLGEAREFLKSQGIDMEPRVAALYINPGAVNRRPKHGIFFAFEDAKGRDKLSRLPWNLKDKHDYV